MNILLKIVIKKIKRMRKIGSDISRELDGLEKLHIFPFFFNSVLQTRTVETNVIRRGRGERMNSSFHLQILGRASSCAW